MKKINLLLQSKGRTQELSFEKTELVVGSSQTADIRISEEGVSAVFCKLIFKEGILFVWPTEESGESIPLELGESFSLGQDAEFIITFNSFEKEEVSQAEAGLKVIEKMASAKSDLPDVEAEVESYLNAVKTAEARMSKTSAKADYHLQSKVSQSSARAHRILEQTSKDIESLTKDAQKKVFYLNHEIEEKSAQLNKTLNFLEGQTTRKQEALDEMTREMEDLEFQKVTIKKDIRVKQGEFSSLQAEYTNLISEKKDEVIHLTEDTNKRRTELEDVHNKLILEEKRFEEKSYIFKKNLANLEAEEKEKENLLSILKENYRNLEEDIEALSHEKDKVTLRVKEEESLLEVLTKKKALVQDETRRIMSESKEEAMGLTKSAVLKAADLKREALTIKEETREAAEKMLLEAKNQASRITETSKENAQKLVDIAKIDAEEILTSAKSKFEQAELECVNKLKAAESERGRMLNEAQESREAVLVEIEAKREQQMKYFDNELTKFKDGLSEKRESHLRLVTDNKIATKNVILDEFKSLIPNFKKTEETTETKVKEEVVQELVEPVAVKLVETEVVEEVLTPFETEAVVPEEKKEAPFVAKEKTDYMKPVMALLEQIMKSLKGSVSFVLAKVEMLFRTVKGVLAWVLNMGTTIVSHKNFKIAVPVAAVVTVCVVMAPKAMTKFKENREIAAVKKEEARKSAEIAAVVKAKEEKKVEEAPREISSIAPQAAKAADVYHGTYTDRVLFTQDYMKNEFKSSYRSKWIGEMRKFVVERAKFSESTLAPIITTETALLRALDQMNKRSKNTDLMGKLEEQLLNKLKKQLKTEELYNEFFKAKETFYKQEYSVK